MTWKPFSSEREYDGFLRINSCGKRELRDRDYDTFRPDGRIDYSLQYIREGVCEVEFGGEMQPVEAGCLILYFPQTPQHYLFREGERSMLLWSHFSGTACGMLEPLRAAQAVVVKVRDRQEFERNFDKLLMAHYHTEPYGEQLEQSYMMVLLSLILKSRSAEEEKLQRIHVGMDQVLTHMLLHFNEPVDLDLYAGMCYVSKNRFIHLFRDYTGMPPYRYQLKIRMDCARELLENTPISVKECAQAVGFGDISYFCRVFRKFTGHTPTWYCSKLAAARLPEPGDPSLFGQNKE